MAGLAWGLELVSSRDREIVEQLGDQDIIEKVQGIAVAVPGAGKTKAKALDEVDLSQMSLFDTIKDEDVIKELMELEITSLTPLDALNTLYQLQNKLKNRWKM